VRRHQRFTPLIMKTPTADAEKTQKPTNKRRLVRLFIDWLAVTSLISIMFNCVIISDIYIALNFSL